MIHLVNDKRKRCDGCCAAIVYGLERKADVTDHHGRFVWYRH